jgi:hypothetical protein
LTAVTFDASHALRFINRARAATGLAALTELPFAGAVRVDERACLLARALQAEVGGSADPRFRDHFVVRLGDQELARAVASRTGQPCNDHAEVLLPEPLARLAVAFDRGQVERRDARYVAPGQLSFGDLETAACQAAAVVGDSSAGHSTKGKREFAPSADSWPAGFVGRLREHSASSSTASHTGGESRGHPGATADSSSEAQAVPIPVLGGHTLTCARICANHGGCHHRVTRFRSGAPARTVAGIPAARHAQAERSSFALRAGDPPGAVATAPLASRRRHRAGRSRPVTTRRSPPPAGQGRRSADLGGTDAARAARPHQRQLGWRQDNRRRALM